MSRVISGSASHTNDASAIPQRAKRVPVTSTSSAAQEKHSAIRHFGWAEVDSRARTSDRSDRPVPPVREGALVSTLARELSHRRALSTKHGQHCEHSTPDDGGSESCFCRGSSSGSGKSHHRSSRNSRGGQDRDQLSNKYCYCGVERESRNPTGCEATRYRTRTGRDLSGSRRLREDRICVCGRPFPLPVPERSEVEFLCRGSGTGRLPPDLLALPLQGIVEHGDRGNCTLQEVYKLVNNPSDPFNNLVNYPDTSPRNNVRNVPVIHRRLYPWPHFIRMCRDGRKPSIQLIDNRLKLLGAESHEELRSF